MNIRLFIALTICLSASSQAAFGQIPQLSSRPGAAYTLYLNFGGFSFTGVWGGSGSSTPGVTPAYSTDADTANFSATEIANMRQVWSRVAEKYIPFNINVTTVDPAPAGSTDSQRQAYYDQQARMMQTVIGGSGGWSSGGGVSFIGVTQNSYTTAGFNSGAGRGYHTNWAFSAQSPSNLQFVADVTSHEHGHGLSLNHQSLWNYANSPPTFVQTYDTGTGSGNGTFAPIMGNSYSTQRGLWRVGATNSNSSITAQNDVAVIRGQSGMAGNGTGGYMDSGIGHTRPTATALPLTGTAVNFSAAKGHIAPTSTTPSPIGEANYTTDYFTFVVPAGQTATLSIVLRSGLSTITPGTADPGATLDATFRLLDVNGVVLQTSSSGVLTETLTVAAASPLQPGTYYLQIASAGGKTDPRGYTYYDIGSYFLTGTFTPVPEPAAVLAVAACGLGLGTGLRRRAGASTQPTTAA